MRTPEAHYTIGVKANQKTVYHDIMATFTTLHADAQQQLSTYETIEKGHGRIETRQYGVTDDLSRLSTRDAWTDLQRIGMVATERQIWTRIEHKTRYFISSRAAEAQSFAQRVRSQWHIEHKLHWQLDVIWVVVADADSRPEIAPFLKSVCAARSRQLNAGR